MNPLEKIVRNVKHDRIEYPVDQWDPPDCGIDGFRIGRYGDWFYMDSPIKRASLCQLFSKLLRLDGDDYFLVTPVEKIRVEVDCFPFCVLLGDQNKSERSWQFTLNNESEQTLDNEHPLSLYFDQEFQMLLPKLLVRNNLYASFHRNVYYQIVESSIKMQFQGTERIGIDSCGSFYPLDEN